VSGGPLTYPQRALQGRIEGEVTAWVYVDATGDVARVVIKESAHDLLSQEVVSTISNWKFKPPMKNGKAVAFIAEYVIDFRFPGPVTYTERL
jgi:TonB family protein